MYNQIPLKIAQQVDNGVDEMVRIASRIYGRAFTPPTIQFNLGGTRAGVACVSTNTIRFNPVLLTENTDHFIQHIVPHEVAHIVADIVYPTGHFTPHTTTKVVPHHGTGWKEVMNQFGVSPIPSHSYNCDSVIGPQFSHMCTECNTVCDLSLYQARCVNLGQAVYHISCGPQGIFRLVSDTPPPMSKMHQCEALYIAHKYVDRSDMINYFIEEAKCTKFGAATYYSTLRKKYDH